VFEPRQAKHVRLTATVNPAKKEKFITISSFNIYELIRDPVSVGEKGEWGSTIDFPLVPVTAWVDPKSHTVVTMSSFAPQSFGGNNHQDERWTFSATWRPGTELVEEVKIVQTIHDMFCPGTSFNANGDVFVTGGATSQAFTIYSTKDSTKESSWSAGPGLLVQRGYHGQTYLPNGRTFMIGGTWGTGDHSVNKNGEIFTPNAGNPRTGTWRGLPNCAAENIKMAVIKDCPKATGICSENIEWRQHHPWLFAWKDGRVFHAGPSKQMNWFNTAPQDGAVTSAGLRLDDGDAVCGIAVMYDAAKGVILTAGGAPNYHYWLNKDFQGKDRDHRKPATKNALEITLTKDNIDQTIKPEKVASMNHPRIFANAVILPTGETFVVGGASEGEPFFDRSWQAVPELYTAEKKWKEMAPHSIPRTYHSWALLLPDATVLVGGGGLSLPQGNHWDAQIYKPHYLFDTSGKPVSSRPKITPLTKNEYNHGEQITFKTDGAVKGASLIRYSAATHALNNDLRRIALDTSPIGSPSDHTYTVTIPREDYVALPGYWMLFVLRDGLVPSEAETIRIRLPGETSSFTNETLGFS
jgi:galactose oxidase